VNLPALAIKYRVVVIFVVVLMVFGGGYAFQNLGKLEDPEFTLKQALVVTTWPGATPHEVELQVTDVIEQAVQTTEGLLEIESLSRAEISIVKVFLKESYRTEDMQQLWDDLRRKVNDCQGSLPPGADPSMVMDDYGDVFGIFLALTGDGFTTAELQEYSEYMQRELLLVKDVARVELFGDRVEVVEVIPSRARMATTGIHPMLIVSALNAQNSVVHTGSLDAGDLRIRVRPSGTFDGVEAIGDLVIEGAPGTPVFLRDVADIRRTTLDPPQRIMHYNCQEALGIGVSVISGGDVVTMGEAVQLRLAEMIAEMPLGIEVNTIYDQPALVTESVDQFLINLAMSVGIVIVVLLVAMGLRSGLIIGSGLILAILGTLIFMLATGINMQRVSLGAFIVAMGMLVDNAIVVVDGALIAMQNGVPRRRAVIEAGQRTAWPLLGSTVVAVLAFLTIYMAPNNTGEYVSSLFIVIGFSLMLSWLLALTQTAVICDLVLK
jgi:multidrug efflux pump subunit AcrB